MLQKWFGFVSETPFLHPVILGHLFAISGKKCATDLLWAHSPDSLRGYEKSLTCLALQNENQEGY